MSNSVVFEVNSRWEEENGLLFVPNQKQLFSGQIKGLLELNNLTGNKIIEEGASISFFGEYSQGIRKGNFKFHITGKDTLIKPVSMRFFLDENGTKLKLIQNDDGFGTYRYTGPAFLDFPSGQRSCEGTFWAGKKDGYWTTFWENGNRKSEEYYFNGVENGSWSFYGEYGESSEYFVYKNGKENGEYKDISYDEKGEIINEVSGNYSNGEKDGIWIYSDYVNRVEKYERYERGKLMLERKIDN
jgi:antitoxin component YwqK of YwqJK toxin-antitoxin module